MASVRSPRESSLLPSAGRSAAIAATDGELLMRFVRHRDQQAFAKLVERHGRLVWVVCRHVLWHHQDVEDAFQATFLILAQRTRSIHASDSVAAWLFKVAQRTAQAARRKRCRRREQKLPPEPPVGDEALPMIQDRDILHMLMDELCSLPERYQTPLVLRYFENHSRRAIAEQTDSTIAQIQGRLVRGRRMLRSRLVRRGVSLSVAAGTLTTASAVANAAVTPMLVADTATSCLTFTTSGAASGTSPAALELAKQGVNAMWYASIMKPAAIVAMLILTAGIVFAAQQIDGTAPAAGNAAAEQVQLQTAVAPTDEVQQPAGTTIAAADEAEPTAVYNVMRIPPRPLELTLEHHRLKAEAYKLKAAVAQNKAAAATGAESSALRGEMLLLQAEAKLAEANSLELESQLKDLVEQSSLQSAQQAAAADERLALPREPVLGPHDALKIEVANAFADQPIDGIYQVEPMGTVPLGANYGRVNVTGLTILEAELAVKEHLAEMLEDPIVQVTLHSKLPTSTSLFEPSPANAPMGTTQFHPRPLGLEQFQQAVAHQFEQLHRELTARKAENAELKKQLERQTRPVDTPPTAPPGSQLPPR